MQYLGRVSGTGVLTHGDREIGRADFDFERYQQKVGSPTCTGEIEANPNVLRSVFGRNDVWLRTGDGRAVRLRFTDKALRAGSNIVNVDAAGDVQAQTDELTALAD